MCGADVGRPDYDLAPALVSERARPASTREAGRRPVAPSIPKRRDFVAWLIARTRTIRGEQALVEATLATYLERVPNEPEHEREMAQRLLDDAERVTDLADGLLRRLLHLNGPFSEHAASVLAEFERLTDAAEAAMRRALRAVYRAYDEIFAEHTARDREMLLRATAEQWYGAG